MEQAWIEDPKPRKAVRALGRPIGVVGTLESFAKLSKVGFRTWLALIWLGMVLGAGGVQATEPATGEGQDEAISESSPSAQSSDVDTVAADADPASTARSDAAPLSPEERRRFQVERNLASVQRNIWWNRPRVIENLDLEESQRHSMDRLLEDYLRGVLQPESNAEDDRAFRQALADGDWDTARRHLDALGDDARQRGMAEGEMMLRVLAELTLTQRKALLQHHEPLLKRSWIKLVSNHRGRPGSARRGAPASNRPQAGAGPPLGGG